MAIPESTGLINNSVKDNPKEVYIRLTKLLGTVKLVRLVELLEDVIEETGYGDVRIIIVEGKVETLKKSNSYK